MCGMPQRSEAMSERETIAHRKIYAVDKDGRGFEIELMIGKPYAISPEEWACPAALIGLHGVFPDLRGVDSWQALTGAHRLLKFLITCFVEDGRKLFWKEHGDELTVDELFGGPQEQPIPDGPLTAEQLHRVGQLTVKEIQEIDYALMSHVTTQWREFARVIGFAMDDMNSIRNVPDVFYAERLRRLVETIPLQSQGNSQAMRFCEVRLLA